MKKAWDGQINLSFLVLTEWHFLPEISSLCIYMRYVYRRWTGDVVRLPWWIWVNLGFGELRRPRPWRRPLNERMMQSTKRRIEVVP